MSIMDWAAWSVIAGLSFISIGGLLLWAYGDNIKLPGVTAMNRSGSAVAARRGFTGVIIYSIALLLFGLGFLIQGTLFILR